MTERKPLLSAEELDALVGSWTADTEEGKIDRMFPLRFWLLFLFMLVNGVNLLLNADGIAERLTADANFIDRLRNMLYFRGWFICLIMAFGAYVYTKDKYIALFSMVFVIVAIVNFLLDMVVIFPERLANSDVQFTFNLFLRLTAILFLFLNLRYCKSIPSLKDRFNIKLAFVKSKV